MLASRRTAANSLILIVNHNLSIYAHLSTTGRCCPPISLTTNHTRRSACSTLHAACPRLRWLVVLQPLSTTAEAHLGKRLLHRKLDSRLSARMASGSRIALLSKLCLRPGQRAPMAHNGARTFGSRSRIPRYACTFIRLHIPSAMRRRRAETRNRTCSFRLVLSSMLAPRLVTRAGTLLQGISCMYMLLSRVSPIRVSDLMRLR